MADELKLLIHVAQQDRWDVAVKNGLNFLKTRGDGDTLRVRLLGNADSVTRCTQCDRPLFDNLKQLVLDGGEVYLCENSLRAFEIEKSRLPELFSTVPAAVRAIAEWQAEGWAYMRP